MQNLSYPYCFVNSGSLGGIIPIVPLLGLLTWQTYMQFESVSEEETKL